MIRTCNAYLVLKPSHSHIVLKKKLLNFSLDLSAPQIQSVSMINAFKVHVLVDNPDHFVLLTENAESISHVDHLFARVSCSEVQ
jgi:hypothetical protein